MIWDDARGRLARLGVKCILNTARQQVQRWSRCGDCRHLGSDGRHFGVRLLEALRTVGGTEIHLVMSKWGQRTISTRRR